MPESRTGPPAENSLADLALLAAGGELDGPEAEAFERRLAEDQTAREALVQAVVLTQALGGTPASPNPAYRAAVRRRLRRVSLTRHPALWASLGAAAAIALMLLLWPRSGPCPKQTSPCLTNTQEEPSAEPGSREPSLEEALFWASLQHSDHLEQVIEEKKKRKGDEATDPRPRRGVGLPMIKH
jgi:hypothetical protein